MTTQYRIIFYNKSTDQVGGLVAIPGQHLSRVLKMAGIRNSREPGEYPLDDKQIVAIASIIGMSIDPSRFIYHLEPLGPNH
jgi:hypothetical protein